jgi:8-oxo-dGTP pyrophosphatase MutT (NUDIX family)
MSYLDHIAACNSAQLEEFQPLRMDDVRVGWLRPEFAQELRAYPKLFRIDSEQAIFHSEHEGFDLRTRLLDELVHALMDRGVIGHYLDEFYPVTPSGREEALCLLDRGSVAHFGVRAFGQHMNGFVRKPGGLHMWIARRAADRRHAPGKLDNLVAGGLPYTISPAENLIKECQEEAGMDESLAARAMPVGAISYIAESPNGLKPDVMYCYDLELPEDFLPVNTDGEVESFQLLPVEEVAEIVRTTDEFKANCNLVIIDFLIRHGLIGPDDKDYEQLVTGLHRQIA